MLLELFGENADITCPEQCCDVCDQQIGLLTDKKSELALIIQAIDELKGLGEVKVTEWIRGGNVAWMQNIVKSNPSAYGKSPNGLSKEWWRCFIRQCSTTGHIKRLIKPATFGATTSIQGAYAQLKPTSKGQNAVSEEKSALLPQLNVITAQIAVKASKAQNKRIGKGKHLLPILKNLLFYSENWVPLDAKEKYQYPGWHDSSVGNILYYTENVKSLPHYSEPHFLWSDIQLSKASTTKNKFTTKITSKEVNLQYWLSHCNGVKK